ncbi:class I SAM-dependent methyltransferase [Curtobacterium sp. MCBA15_004]|uniref:class I SAM-dependent methyltransferase n=1 Tax=Curtobacterium sp. MCBA15_004 TaxID=1898733 RepID=UPI0008DD4DF6|nr:class I SAM-dependent methyltransferase [Curtobacterium sp. MCBA15_004]WIA96160.1 class I SAM-dependent methyltransferase [Curtobacterium sp. MCBA15_004]
MTLDRFARSFGSAVDAYERGRPGYPAAVAAALVPDGTDTVVDVGAGTGKFTRTLLGRADHVVAVEPDPAMRARLVAELPGVRALDGTGEAIPLDDGEADVVTFAQSWHWVDPDPGAAEVARVLRPGGVLGLVWNARVDDRGWAERIGRLVPQPETRRSAQGAPVVGPPFGPVEHHEVRWTLDQDRDGFLDAIASRSAVIVLPADERAALLDAVRRVLDDDPETAGRSTIPVEYVTRVHRSVRA